MNPSSKKQKLIALSLDRIDLVTAGANPDAAVTIWKKAEQEKVTMSDVVEMTEEAPDAPAVDEPVAEESAPAVVADDMVAKADFEALKKALDAATAKAVAADERIAKMERDKKEAEFVAKARDLANMGEAAELGKMLLEASEGMSEQSYQLLERTLKAANAQVEKGALFAQLSKTETEPADVMGQIQNLAEAKVAAGEAKTIQLAKLAVIAENPSLRDDYLRVRNA